MATAYIEGEQKMSTAKIAKALADFQKDLPTVTEDGKNPHFGSKFTTLGNLSSVVLPKLSEHGMGYSAPSRIEDGKMILTPTLLHVSGESLSIEFIITDTQPQKVGSAVTYYRRYGLGALTGVVADADDDGNAASAQPPAAVQKAQNRKPAAAPAAKLPPSQAKIKAEFLDVSEPPFTREQINGLLEVAKADGKKGEAAWAVVYDRLKKGEVA